MGTSEADKAKRGVLGVAFLTLFLDLLGFGIILPIQPFLAESFGARPAVVTLLAASYSAMQLVFAPFWGRLSDRYGRRPIVLTSIAIAALGFLTFGLAHAMWMLFAARMIAGFGNANIGTVQAVIADVTSGKDRARGMGMLGAAFGLGFLFGPVIGGVLASFFGPQSPAFVSVGLCALNWVLAYKLLPETRKPGATHEARGLFALKSVRDAFALVNGWQLLFVYCVFTTGFALMETSINLFMEHELIGKDILGTDAGHTLATKLATGMLATVGVFAAIIQGGLIGKLKSAVGEKRMLVVGCVIVAIAFVLVSQAPPFGYPVVLAAGAVIGIGSFTNPAMSALLSRAAPEDRQGELLSIGQAMSALGRIVGPLMSGLLFERMHGLPLLVGAVLVAACAIVGATMTQPSD